MDAPHGDLLGSFPTKLAMAWAWCMPWLWDASLAQGSMCGAGWGCPWNYSLVGCLWRPPNLASACFSSYLSQALNFCTQVHKYQCLYLHKRWALKFHFQELSFHRTIP